jgi:hypothetical protein
VCLHFVGARGHLLSGDPARAVFFFEQALALDPNHKAAAEGLVRLRVALGSHWVVLVSRWVTLRARRVVLVSRWRWTQTTRRRRRGWCVSGWR